MQARPDLEPDHSLHLHSGPCCCPDGVCAMFVEPVEHCIGRIARTHHVETAQCPKCGPGYTWHADGKCLKCAYRR